MSVPTAEHLELRTPLRSPGSEGRPWRPARNRRTWWLVALVLAAGWAAHGAGLDAAVADRHGVLNPDGWPVARRFLSAAAHPALDPIFVRLIGEATLVTIAYATLGAAGALVLGALGAPLLSTTWWRRLSGRVPLGGRVAWTAGRAGAALPRGLHEAVWGILLVNVLGLDPLVAVLAVTVPFGAVTAKVWADLLDEVPSGPYTHLRSGGAGRLVSVLYGLVPPAAGDLLSYSFYRFECALRSAVVLGIVGAGGLGFQLELSFSALRYPEMWTVLGAVVVLCAGVEGVGAHVRRRLHRRSCLRPTAASAGSRDPLLVGGLVAVAGLVVWSWSYVGVHPSTLVSARAREQASLVLADAWPLRTDGATVRTLLRLAGETLQMSVLALVLAAGGGALLALLAARLPRAGVRRRTTAAAVRALLLVLRGVPPPVWALLLLFVTLPGPLPGALALAGYNLGILGRLMAETVENLEPGPTDALRSTGASPAAAWLYGTLPRVAPRFLVVALYRWEVAVRETVVVGLVGAGGLGTLLADRIAAFDWAGVASTLVALVLLTLLVDLLSTAARSAVR